MSLSTPADSARRATEIFCTFTDDKPDLIKTGFVPIDEIIGGLFPGSAGIIAACTGVGKSRLIHAAIEATTERVGVISTEDTPDVWGSRFLAGRTGISSLRIRTKQLSDDEKKLIKKAMEELEDEEGVHFSYCISPTIEEVEEACAELTEAGCRMVYLDYLQKVSGSSQDRRNEISNVLRKAQRACSRGGASLLAVSQFSRNADETKRPSRHWLKESGDLENEARIIVMAYRPHGPEEVYVVLDKSTFGGEGARFVYRTADSGCLELLEEDENEELFGRQE